MPKFKVGDTVTLISEEYLDQLNDWKDRKAVITEIWKDPRKDDGDCIITIVSGNNYTNNYPAKDLRLRQINKNQDKLIETNKTTIKKMLKKKNQGSLPRHITIYCIKNYNILIK